MKGVIGAGLSSVGLVALINVVAHDKGTLLLVLFIVMFGYGIDLIIDDKIERSEEKMKNQ